MTHLPLSPAFSHPGSGDKKLKLAVLGSTRGTNLTAIVDAIQTKNLNAEIILVLSNKADAGILVKAENFGLAQQALVPEVNESRNHYDQRLIRVLKAYQAELVVLIGYMRILSPEVIAAFPNRIINVHPSLLPKHKGLMNLAVHEAVLRAHETESGCSVHWVTEEVDAGQVLVQKHCPVYKEDTPETLKARVQALEGAALVAAIRIIAGEYKGYCADTTARTSS